MKTGYVSTPQGRLYYEETGEGPPLVLLHVGVADLNSWDDQFEVFGERYRTVRYDAMNYARSDTASGPFSNHEHLRAVMDALGIEKAALVGVSMGGGTAIDFTLTWPERVTALIAVAPGLGGYDYANDEALTSAREEINRLDEAGDGAGAIDGIVRLWVDGPNRTPGQVDATVRQRVADAMKVMWERGDPEFEAGELELPAISRLGEIKTPTLVVYGSGDVRALVGASQAVAENVPGAEMAVIEGLGHVPHMERPGEFNRLVMDFLAKNAI